MIAPVPQPPPLSARPNWHEQFLKMLPAIRRYAAFAFRNHPQEVRSELIAEVVATACVAFARLVQQGRADLAYATPLAVYGCRQVRDGRRVGMSRNSRDVLSVTAQQRHEFSVKRLDPQEQSAWRQATFEDHRTPVADQAAFRCDFPAWLGTLSRRNRGLAELLARGESTSRAARRFRLSPARVSQLRREFAQSWQRFHGDEPCPN